MYILLSSTILAFAATLMVILRILRPGFGYHWLLAVGSAFAAWIAVLFSYTSIPETMQVMSWGLGTEYFNSVTLSIDHASWPFAAALGTLLVATLFSDVVRAYDLSWSNWASGLLVVAIGLVGILAGNLLTFLLAWMAYDLVVLVILLAQLDTESLRRRTVWVFFFHLLGTLCLLIAGVISVNETNSLLLDQASPQAIIFVVLAAGFRFGALPLDSQMQADTKNRRSFGTVRSLASMAIVSIFLVRIAGGLENVDLFGSLWTLLFSVIGFTSLLYSFAWFTARDELQGRQAWIMAFGLIILGSTLRAETNAGLAWGLAAIISGGLIFLASVRTKFIMWITLLGIIGISTLPFSAAWAGAALFSSPFSISLLFYFVSLIFLIAGYAHHAAQLIPEPSGLERWIKVVYPIGLILLTLAQLGLGILYRPDIGEISLSAWLVSLSLVVFSALVIFWERRGGSFPRRLIGSVTILLSFKWLRFVLTAVFQISARFLHFISSILEGEGGILWVMLSIVLFLAILLIRLGS